MGAPGVSRAIHANLHELDPVRGLLNRSTMSIKTTMFVASLAACGSAPPEPTTTADKRDHRLDTLDKLRAAVEAKDAHAVAALYAERATLEPIGGHVVQGRAAIEVAMRAELAPAATIRVGFPRVWLKDDVAIVETAFRASHTSAAVHDIGGTEFSVLWFDRDGLIARERSYQEQETLDEQAAGEPDASPLPVISAAMEVHAGSSPDDAAAVAWANGVMAKSTRSDAETLAVYDEHIKWDCALGAHLSSRAELVAPLAHFRTAFPDQQYTATNVWPVEDYIIVEETLTGTHQGDLGSFVASHKPVSWHWIEIWQVQGDQIVHGWSWTNLKELEQQIGLPTKSKLHPACSVEP
jgi:ketosteroid isomerase-like protein/predicted ester cyclase